MNRLILAASLVERRVPRYTPAGLPALDLSLKCESEVVEDGQRRQVSFETRAVAIGRITEHVARLPLGQVARFAGFLAAGRNGRGLVFHLTEVDASDPA